MLTKNTCDVIVRDFLNFSIPQFPYSKRWKLKLVHRAPGGDCPFLYV